MKTVRCFIMVFTMLFCATATVQAYTSPGKRIVKVINKNWKFIHSDGTGREVVGFNDAAWLSVGLPHSFEWPYWRTNMGTTPLIGWYRKHITVDTTWIATGKRIFIEFEAAFLIAEVYANGTLVGTHTGGYTGFSYDITSNVHTGDNVIAVRVNATWNPKVAPRGGEHIFAGGIYRDVYLVVTEPLHVPWCGTFVTTPTATSAAATVRVRTEIKNNASTTKTCNVVSVICDSAGNTVTSMSSTFSLTAGQLDTFDQLSGTISSPHLWTPDTNQATPPAVALNLNKRAYLYAVHTEVYDGTTLVDNFTSPLGIRSIAWNTTNGFELNGKKMWCKTANVHQDHAGWGDGTCNTGSARDVKMMKNAGFNMIRGSHYPHDPAFLDACDSLGLCFWSEATFWGIGSFTTTEPPATWHASAYPTVMTDTAAFNANLILQLLEMIRIHRNHPCVTIWSAGNEFGYSSAGVMPGVQAILARMIVASHRADSTRPIGQGIGYGNWPALNTATEVIGLNGGATNCPYTVNSPVVSFTSEYGSCYPVRNGASDNYDGCFDGQAITNIDCTPAVPQASGGIPIHLQWRPGIALWCAFDHGSNYGMGTMGMVDHARVPKRRYYYYRYLYANIAQPTLPVAGTASKLYMTKDCDTITDDGQSDVMLTVQIQNAAGAWLSNQAAITITDASGKGLFPSSTTGSSSISFVAGQAERGVINGLCAIEYRCYDSTAGLVTLTATSGTLTYSSVQVYVKHVDYTTGVSSLVPVKFAAGPTTAVMKVLGKGSSITLPKFMQGKKVALSMYDLRGRLIRSEIISKKRSTVRYNMKNTESVVIVKLRTIE